MNKETAFASNRRLVNTGGRAGWSQRRRRAAEGASGALVLALVIAAWGVAGGYGAVFILVALWVIDGMVWGVKAGARKRKQGAWELGVQADTRAEAAGAAGNPPGQLGIGEAVERRRHPADEPDPAVRLLSPTESAIRREILARGGWTEASRSQPSTGIHDVPRGNPLPPLREKVRPATGAELAPAGGAQLAPVAGGQAQPAQPSDSDHGPQSLGEERSGTIYWSRFRQLQAEYTRYRREHVQAAQRHQQDLEQLRRELRRVELGARRQLEQHRGYREDVGALAAALRANPDLARALYERLGRPQSPAADLQPPAEVLLPPAVPTRTAGLSKVAGMRVLKQILVEQVVQPLKEPEAFRPYGLTIPNGILLFGPPGCGKTYIARALAEEVDHKFIEVVPSEVGSLYIHGATLRIRELFDKATKDAPAILFMDEFEALVPSRGELGGHQQYKSEEVNEFLVHLAECSQKRILVIAATNEPWKIDQAVLRSGRLDKHFLVDPPDLDARVEMLRYHLAGRLVEGAIDTGAIAARLEGYSAADIKLLVDEAARDAMKANAPISAARLMRALDRVPASVTAEITHKYSSFRQRGI